MLNNENEIEKSIIKNYSSQTQVNSLNSWLRSWYEDNLIKTKPKQIIKLNYQSI